MSLTKLEIYSETYKKRSKISLAPNFALTLLRRLFLLAARHSANKFALCSRSAASVRLSSLVSRLSSLVYSTYSTNPFKYSPSGW